MVKMRGDQLLMTDEERWRASIDQIYTYGNSQYPEWRVVAVKSIRKLLFNLEEFYGDMLPDLEYEGSQVDIVHGQIVTVGSTKLYLKLSKPLKIYSRQ